MELNKSTISTIVICSAIILFLLGVLVKSLNNNNALKILLQKLENALPHETKKKKWRNDQLELEKSSEEGQLEKIADAEDEFSGLCATYNMLCQLVTIFPLLGIFGTVLGIIFMGDVSAASMSDFNLALWTTLFGLVGSIVLKAVLALLNGKNIALFENKVESYYRSLDTVSLRAKMNKQQ